MEVKSIIESITLRCKKKCVLTQECCHVMDLTKKKKSKQTNKEKKQLLDLKNKEGLMTVF